MTAHSVDFLLELQAPQNNQESERQAYNFSHKYILDTHARYWYELIQLLISELMAKPHQEACLVQKTVCCEKMFLPRWKHN